MNTLFLKYRETMLKAIAKWGANKQTDMLHEEIGELLQAVNKHKRKNSLDNRENLLEEIADVEIMLEQQKLMIAGAAHSAVEAYKERKLQRLTEKLSES